MSDVPVLVCTDGAMNGARIRIPEGGLTVGRADDNDVVLPEDGVSRFHARFLYDNGSLWLQDAGSRNGIFVNGIRVTGHQALRVGDEITIAEHVFTLGWDESGAESEPDRVVDDEAEDKGRPWWWPFG